MKEFTNPEFVVGIAGYIFSWPDMQLLIELQRLSDDGRGEIGVYHSNGSVKEQLKYTRINLLDDRGVGQITKALEKNNTDIDWQRVMTYVTGKAIATLRTGEPVKNINCEPESKAVTWSVF
ncbi:hypothetical protein ACFLVH_05880, partial [Chloroflexota bacterium]